MKTCSKCQREKDLSLFSRDKSTKDGLSVWCVDCTRAKNRAGYEVDKARRLEKAKAQHAADPEGHKARCKSSYQANREDRIAKASARNAANPKLRKRYARQTYLNNPEAAHDRWALRQRRLTEATPPWVDKEAILAFYREARRRTAETGIPHEVDHLDPLQHDTLCGLHVPWNLEVKTQEANRRKGNSISHC